MNWSALKGLARDWLVAVAIVFVIWILWVRFMSPQPRSSGPAPTFALETLDGNTVTQETHEDVVVLNFWFTSCPPCRREIPELARYHTHHPEVPMYGVSVDKMPGAKLAAISRKLGINYPILHDRNNGVANDFQVSLFPTTVVLHQGEIAAVRMGEVTEKSLAQMVDSVHGDH